MTGPINITIPETSGFTHILFNLAAQGISHIKISYNGSGDSGAIDEVWAIKRGDIEEKDGEIKEKDNLEELELNKDLKQIIEEASYNQILNDADDWCNNDGGGGVLYLSTADGSYYCDHYINVMTTQNEILTGKLHD